VLRVRGPRVIAPLKVQGVIVIVDEVKKMKLTKTKLPKTIYVKQEAERDETYLLPALSPEELAAEDRNEKVTVGLYELKSTLEVTTTVEVVERD